MSAPGKGGSQVKKFEWVSSLGHQMSLVRFLYSGGRAGGPCSEVSCLGQGWGGVGVSYTVRSHIQGARDQDRGL